MALDHYAAAKTADQRAAVVSYLKSLDHKLVAAALVDHIVASRTGNEATAFNGLIDALSSDTGAAIIERMGKVVHPAAKGKLIVALRRCPGAASRRALEGCLDDKRPVPFEARGPLPRRVCDMAYDELYLQLRSDRHYGLDPSPHMKGLITETMPVKKRDSEIAKLKAKLAKYPPAPSKTPSKTPVAAMPATAALTLS